MIGVHGVGVRPGISSISIINLGSVRRQLGECCVMVPDGGAGDTCLTFLWRIITVPECCCCVSLRRMCLRRKNCITCCVGMALASVSSVVNLVWNECV